MTEPDHDVVIVGGGPVGLALACMLAQRAIDVVVCERSLVPSTRSRAFGIHPPGLAVLAGCGIGDSIRAESVAIESGRVECRGKLLGRMRFPDPVRSVSQGTVELLLAKRLEELLPGALQRGVEVVDTHDEPGGVAVSYTSAGFAGTREGAAGGDGAGDVGGVGGGEVRAGDKELGVGVMRCRYLVAADGVHSRIRASLGSRAAETSQRGIASYLMADALDTSGDTTEAILYLEPSGVVESFPLPGGRRRWVARCDTSEIELSVMVSERVGAEPQWVSAPSAFIAKQFLAQSWVIDRTILVGDAAHEVSPIGGQGMNLGWLDARALAEGLATSIACGSAAELHRYERVRSRAAKRACRRAAFNMAMGAPVSGGLLWLRNALARLCALPPFDALFADTFTMRGL